MIAPLMPFKEASARACIRLLALLFPVCVIAQPPPVASFAKWPNVTDVRISPTGAYIAMAVPVGKGTGIAILRLEDQAVLTRFEVDPLHSIYYFDWAGPERIIFEPAVESGPLDIPRPTGELMAFDIDGGNKKYLFGFRQHSSTNQLISGSWFDTLGFTGVIPLQKEPGKVLIGVNFWSTTLDKHEVAAFRLDTSTGKFDRKEKLPIGDLVGILADNNGDIRLTVGQDNDDKALVYAKVAENAEWQKIPAYGEAGTEITPVAMSPDAADAYLLVREKEGRRCLERLHLADAARVPQACDPVADVEGVAFSFDGQLPIAATYLNDMPRNVPLATIAHPDQKALRALQNTFPEHFIRPVSTTSDGRLVVLHVSSDRDPGGFYLFDTTRNKVRPLVGAMEWIDPATMAVTSPISYTARDGQVIHGLLTVPKGAVPEKLPLIVMPHGGPFGVQDILEWNAETQLLASRGYLVLQTNFRGSDGYGRAFINAGKLKWDSTMIDDITDGARWAVQQKYADPGRLCIYGASYGGYAAMESAVREPDLYRCAVTVAGVYDLDRWSHTFDFSETEWGQKYIAEYVGATAASREAASPLSRIDNLKVPVLIVHGTADARVPYYQAVELMRALDKRHHPYEKLIFQSEAHGFYLEKNRQMFYERLLAFLDRNLALPMPAVPDGSAP